MKSATDITSLGTSKKERRRGGLLDVTLMALLLYAVYAKTPCGALPVYAYRSAKDLPTPNLIATFQGRETEVEIELPKVDAKYTLATKTFPKVISDAAAKAKIDPEILVSYMLTIGETCEDEACSLTATRHLAFLVDDYLPSRKATIEELAEGIGKAMRSVGGDEENGIEALYIGLPLTKRAVLQARNSDIETPADIEKHSEFITPSIRRGELQQALKVLALHRLRTLAWPADTKWRISSPYGFRVHPVLKKRKLHNGTDIATPTGTPLLSAQKGRVTRKGRGAVAGNNIKVDHGFGVVTQYLHMSKIDVEKGDDVTRKQVLGEAGSTGRVTGAHLHYILRIEGQTVDAELYGESPTRKELSKEQP